MGKIIKTIGGRIGHVIGGNNKNILCEKLDEDYNFIIVNNKKEVFSCKPENVSQQIGYLDPTIKFN